MNKIKEKYDDCCSRLHRLTLPDQDGRKLPVADLAKQVLEVLKDQQCRISNVALELQQAGEWNLPEPIYQGDPDGETYGYYCDAIRARDLYTKLTGLQWTKYQK